MSLGDSTITPISAPAGAAAATQRAGSVGAARRIGSATEPADFRAALGVSEQTPSWLPSTEPSASESDAAQRPERRLPPQLELSDAESNALYQNRIVLTAAADSTPRPSTSGRSTANAYQSASRSYAAAFISTDATIATRGERLEVSA